MSSGLYMENFRFSMPSFLCPGIAIWRILIFRCRLSLPRHRDFENSSFSMPASLLRHRDFENFSFPMPFFTIHHPLGANSASRFSSASFLDAKYLQQKAKKILFGIAFRPFAVFRCQPKNSQHRISSISHFPMPTPQISTPPAREFGEYDSFSCYLP